MVGKYENGGNICQRWKNSENDKNDIVLENKKKIMKIV